MSFSEVTQRSGAYARLVARVGLDIALGAAAFVLLLLFFFLSQYASFLPVAEANRVTAIAVLQKHPRVSLAHVQKVTEAAHWYLQAVLPALVGIGQGLVVGFLRRGANPTDALVTGLMFGAILLISMTFHDFVDIAGPVLFTFCYNGFYCSGTEP
jgi:Na+-driven multidrug efflux pump